VQRVSLSRISLSIINADYGTCQNGISLYFIMHNGKLKESHRRRKCALGRTARLIFRKNGSPAPFRAGAAVGISWAKRGKRG
jgi:hypothetical protein